MAAVDLRVKSWRSKNGGGPKGVGQQVERHYSSLSWLSVSSDEDKNRTKTRSYLLELLVKIF